MTEAALILPDGREVGLRGDSFVGRDQVNQIQIENSTVSRRHALLVERDDKWWIADSGSYNGTFLNDRRLPPGVALQLRHADRIGVGSEVLVFSAPSLLEDPDRTEPHELPQVGGRPALVAPAAGRALPLRPLARGREPRRASVERADRRPARDARLGGDRQGGAPAGVLEGRSHRGQPAREAPRALPRRTPARLGLSHPGDLSDHLARPSVTPEDTEGKGQVMRFSKLIQRRIRKHGNGVDSSETSTRRSRRTSARRGAHTSTSRARSGSSSDPDEEGAQGGEMSDQQRAGTHERRARASRAANSSPTARRCR